MKTLFIQTVSILALIIGTQFNPVMAQQTGSVWTRIPNADKLMIQTIDNKIFTQFAEVNALIETYAITAISQAVPASRNPYLQELYQIDCNCDENDLLQAVSKMNSVFKGPEIGPHYDILSVPNDFSLAVTYDYALNLINASGAWEISKGDPNLLISITDAGFIYGHEELANKVTYISPTTGTSNVAHGTAVATTAAGATDNSQGKSSIGYNCSLELRGMNYNELLASTYSGAKVVNASWAAGCYYSSYGQDIVNEIYNNGTVIVAAAGNGSTCNNPAALVYPAAYEHVISVSSVGPGNNHERTPGNPLTTHQHNAMVDITAPGYDVALTTSNNIYTTGNGSSFAAPMVSGTIGLMLSINPCLTVDEVELILKMSADTLSNYLNPNYAGLLGAGRLDAQKALQMAKNFNTFNAELNVETYCEFQSQVITLNTISGVAPYQMSWSTGDTSDFCIVGPAGLYTVDITDSLGCRNHQEITIEIMTPIELQVDIQNVSCHGSNDGTATVEISGGLEEYVANWSNGQEGRTVTGLSTGNYEVHVTDARGCSQIEYITISEPDALAVTLEIVNPTEFDLGSVDVTVDGGTGYYSFSWSNGASSEDLDQLNEGIYQVTVSDENGCVNSKLAILQQQNVATLSEIQNETILVYPNPAKEKFTLELPGIELAQINLKNQNGQILHTQAYSGMNSTVEVSDYANGVYFVEILLPSGNATHKQLVIAN